MPAGKTVEGVPALPQDRPSDLEMTRERVPKPDEDEAPTAIAAKSMTAAEADRVLAGAPAAAPTGPSAGVAGAVPAKPGASAMGPVKTPPLGRDMFPGLARPADPH